jgi:dsDNA-binding SOS-regulon protein
MGEAAMNDSMTKTAQDVQDKIRDVAYLMWEAAGRQQELAMQYWLAAEKEVLSAMGAAATKLTPAPEAAAAPAQKEAAPRASKKAK